MDRRRFLATTGMGLGAVLAGCAGGTGGATGTLATLVSDQPRAISEFERCIVTIEEIIAYPAEAGAPPTGSATATTAEAATPVRIDAGGATADLVKLRGERAKLINEEELPTGEYAALQLQVANRVDAVHEEQGKVEVRTPGDAPLTFNASFEIRADRTTRFTADFTVVRAGPTGRYLLKPVPDEIAIEYGTVATTTTG